jgi:uncharacterized protein (TIGR02271 family)
MTHQLFSESDDWELENDGQDVRGWSVVDAQGSTLGTVTDMLVDTDTETIDRLVLDSGSEIDISSVAVGDGTITVADAAMGATGTMDRDTSWDTGTATTDMDTTTSTAATGTTGMTGTSDRSTGSDAWRLRRHEEELRADTREEQVGEVSVGKHVVEEERQIDVPVTREEVQIRRVAVDRPAEGAQIVDEGDVIRVPVTAERVEVTKEPHVVEEVEIGKTTRTDTERVTDTVRREEFDIDREGDTDVRGDRGI